MLLHPCLDKRNPKTKNALELLAGNLFSSDESDHAPDPPPLSSVSNAPPKLRSPAPSLTSPNVKKPALMSGSETEPEGPTTGEDPFAASGPSFPFLFGAEPRR
jgi:hypothetical protein